MPLYFTCPKADNRTAKGEIRSNEEVEERIATTIINYGRSSSSHLLLIYGSKKRRSRSEQREEDEANGDKKLGVKLGVV